MADQPVKKKINRIKALVESAEGPARKDQSAVPIADAMRACWERDMLTFGIPAHNGGWGPAPDFTRWPGAQAARYDLQMSHGVDTGYRAWKVQTTAQELFAEAVGAEQTLFSTNGSSMSLLVTLMTAARSGETVVTARDGRKSSFAIR